MFSRLLHWFRQPKQAHWLVLLLPVIFLLPLMMMPQTLDDLVHHHVFAQSLPIFSGASWWRDLFVFLDGNSARTQQVIEQFLLPWWTDEQIQIAFFRPLSALTHWVDFQLWPNSHALNHLHSFIWLGLLILLVFKLYKTLVVDYRIAILAGLLFAFDASHFIPATWVANRNILVAGVFGVACLLTYIKCQQTHRLSWYGFSLLLFLACLYSAEAGVSIGAFILAYALCLDSRPWRNRIAKLAGYGLVFVIWYYQYKAMGYGASGNGFYLDPATDPVAFTSALSWKYLLYVLMYFIGLPSAGYYSGGMPQVWLLFTAIALTFAMGLLLWPLLKKNAAVRFWLLSFFLALLPIASSSPHERTMVMAGIAANALMAILLVSVFGKNTALTTQYEFVWKTAGRFILMPVIVVFVLLHGVLHPLGLAVIPVSTWAIHNENPLQKQLDTLPALSSEHTGRIYLNAPSTLFVSTLHLYRATKLEKNQRMEPQFLLTPSAKMLKVERHGNHSVRLLLPPDIKPTAYDRLFRASHNPVKQGQLYQVGDMSAEVIAVNHLGLPIIVDYRWPYSLDRFQVLAWTGERFEQVLLPKTLRHEALVIQPQPLTD